MSRDDLATDFLGAFFNPAFLKTTMEDTGRWVAWCVEIALRSDESRYLEARRVAVEWAKQGVRAARRLGLYADDGGEP
jgi:hypothetical protein